MKQNSKKKSSSHPANGGKIDPAQVFDSLGYPLLVVDRSLKTIVMANRKAQSLFGHPTSIADLGALLQTPKKNQLSTSLSKALESGKEKTFAFTFSKKSWQARLFPYASGITMVIEERKEAPSQSRAAFYEKMFDSMGDLVMVTDDDFNIIEGNEPFFKSIGHDRRSMGELSSLGLGANITAEKMVELKRQARQRPILFDVSKTTADGASVDFEINFFSFQIDGKNYYGAVSRDITEFKTVQSDLAKSNERFELISSATQEALWELDLITGERWANEIHQGLYGLTSTDAVPGEDLWEKCIHHPYRKKVVGGFRKAIQRCEPKFECEYWFRREDGTDVYIYDRTIMLYNESGNLTKMLGSMVDITALKRAQEELNSQVNLSEGIINSLPGVFYLLDRKGKFLRWNKNFEKITGYSADEIKDVTAEKFFYHAEAPGLWKKISEVFQKGKAEMEANLINKTGEGRPFYLTGWRTIIANEECLIGTGIDMSEIKKAQETLSRMELKITEQRVQEQKTISRAIINAQEKERNHIGRELHDNVNQLLAGARLYLTMGAKKSDEFAELIKYPIELLDSGIQEIRSLTHRNITPSKDMDLKQLLEGVAAMLNAGTIECTLNYDVKKELNENLLINVYRILQEQAANIIRHSEAKNVTIDIYDKGTHLYINTVDDGIGFDVHKFREGIGLYNIYSRVEAYNGNIEIKSEPGKGCEIEIRLPAFAYELEQEYTPDKSGIDDDDSRDSVLSRVSSA